MAAKLVKAEEKRPAHRPSTYTTEIIERANKYIDGDNEGFPNIAGMAVYLGTSRKTLYEWAKEHQELSDTLERLREVSEATLATKSLHGKFNPTFAIFYAKARLGMKENDAPQAQQVNIQVVTNGESPQITIG